MGDPQVIENRTDAMRERDPFANRQIPSQNASRKGWLLKTVSGAVRAIQRSQHNAEAQRQCDRLCDQWLRSAGSRILRYWKNEIFDEWESVVEAVWKAAQGRPLAPRPLSCKRRGEIRARTRLPQWGMGDKAPARRKGNMKAALLPLPGNPKWRGCTELPKRHLAAVSDRRKPLAA
jgi:hypothetical protein